MSAVLLVVFSFTKLYFKEKIGNLLMCNVQLGGLKDPFFPHFQDGLNLSSVNI